MKRERGRLIKAGITAALFLAAVLCYTVENGGLRRSAGSGITSLSGMDVRTADGTLHGALEGQTEDRSLHGALDARTADGSSNGDSEETRGGTLDGTPESEDPGMIPPEGDSLQHAADGTTGGENQSLAQSGTGSGLQVPVTIFVHVCGEVVSPGVYELPEGSRVFEAVEAAGGLTEQGEGSFLNQAMVLTDGIQVRIPSREEAKELWESGGGAYAGTGSGEGIYRQAAGTGVSGGGQAAGNGTSVGVSQGLPGSGSAGAGGRQSSGNTASGVPEARVNLNTATKQQLMTLTGIGEARADAILAYRENMGPFQRIEDIMKVSGIKEAAFQKIKDDICV